MRLTRTSSAYALLLSSVVAAQVAVAQDVAPPDALLPPSLSNVGAATPPDPVAGGAVPPLMNLPGNNGGSEPPALTDNRSMTPDRIEGFNSAIEQVFPMTPEMIRRYQEIYSESQRAMLERPEPKAMITTDLVTLEPGAAPPLLNVAPGVASVVNFLDAAGNPWPVTKYVLGNGSAFQVLHLGDDSNVITVTPLTPVGTTNLVIALKDAPAPLVMRVVVGESRAHYRHDIQIAEVGPNTDLSITDVPQFSGDKAGSKLLLAALTGVDLPSEARPVSVEGVDAMAWRIGSDLFVRSKVPLISPSWSDSLAGPNGARAYRLAESPVLLFSVDGRITRATLRN